MKYSIAVMEEEDPFGFVKQQYWFFLNKDLDIASRSADRHVAHWEDDEAEAAMAVVVLSGRFVGARLIPEGHTLAGPPAVLLSGKTVWRKSRK